MELLMQEVLASAYAGGRRIAHQGFYTYRNQVSDLWEFAGNPCSTRFQGLYV